MKSIRGNKEIAPVVDIFPQLALGYHTEERVAEEMRLLKEFGFKRVYFVLCNPGYPMFSSPVLCMQPPDVEGLENYAFKSIVALGDPNFSYVRQCHKHGMEAIAVFKPYEGGGGSTVPHGARLPYSPAREETIGGDRIGFDNLLSTRPDLRIKRKPIPNYDRLMAQPVEGIALSFCLDSIDGEAESGKAEAVDAPVRYHLFTSSDNGAYHRHEGALKITETIEKREIRDANGVLVYPEPRRCRSVVLSGFRFTAETRYFAVVMEKEAKLFTIPQAMITLRGAEGDLPSTVSPFIRRPGNAIQEKKKPGDRVWGMEIIPSCPENFSDAMARIPEWGYEHHWYGGGFHGVGWIDCCAYGVAKGVFGWMKGTPCEAYPEVRAYWMDVVNRCIEMGFDGVDLRLQNHSGMVSDYANFGYNEPIVEAYRKKHGVDILKNEADPLKLMRVRGDFYMQFVEEAAAALHKAGRKLQMHLRHANEEPQASMAFNELGFWAMPKIQLEDWRKVIDLADEITLKDYHFNNYDPARAAQIKAYAREKGKRVWIHCYISQGREMNEPFFNQVMDDDTVGGILLYEVCNSNKNEVNFGLIEQYGPVGLNEPVAKELRKLLATFFKK